jgi:hypothetical protein
MNDNYGDRLTGGIMKIGAMVITVLFISLTVPIVAAADGDANGNLVGFAFVSSSVTSEGSLAKLPAGTKIYPPGSTITGSEGCPTNRYHTDGLIVAVIDYQGRPNEGSVTVIRHPAPGMSFPSAPYYLDLNPGRTLQYLGPIGTNGTYDVQFSYNYAEGQQKSSSARLTLARNCAGGGGF